MSLLGIVVMLGYKVSLARSGALQMRGGFHVTFPNFAKLKSIARKGLRRYGFIALVIVIKLYVKTTYFLKQKFQLVQSKVVDILKKNKKFGFDENSEKREVSGFLKMVSEYKHRVRTIKHRIVKEEESGN